ncbi:MAG TPA: sulfite exporter TauE/SafE family protein [Candidatus Gallacutalibacter stercoravium]|nr:sulfite exporter TauE/SafE family protein [Candidatus Gallacutalibacter stercoravium]
MNWMIVALAGVLSGILGAMGLGGGGVLIIYLTLIANMEQPLAQGINLIFFIPSAVIALILYARKKMIDWGSALPAAALGLIGAWLGSWLSSILNRGLLGKIFGGFLLLMGIWQLFSKPPSGAKGQKPNSHPQKKNKK